MDTIKIGNFLRELRKEKNLTQEQLADVFNVSARTVSRWETGSNMPDISILVEIADYYDLDVREILPQPGTPYGALSGRQRSLYVVCTHAVGLRVDT